METQINIKIVEIARRTDYQSVTIHYYVKEGPLPEQTRSASKLRLYRVAHIKRLHFIRHCHSLDMKLSEVRALLSCRDTLDQDCGEFSLLDIHIQQTELRI